MHLFQNNKSGSDNNSCFNEIYFKYYKYAYTIAINLLKNPDLVDDVLQDSFIKVYKELETIRRINSELAVKAFISVIVRNTAKNAVLKKSKEKSRLANIDDTALENILADNTGDPLENLIISEGVELIKREIYNLPEKYSSVLELKYIHKYNTAKIAELLNIKVKTVYVRIDRGKILLLKKLNSLEDVPSAHYPHKTELQA